MLSEGGVEYRISNIEQRNREQGTRNRRTGNREQGIEEQKNKEQGTRNRRTGNREQGTKETKPKPQIPSRLLGTKLFPPTIIPQENIYQYLSIAAPYIDLVEEMTAKEFLHFHQKFKPLLPSFSLEEIFSIIGLEKSVDKQIRYFSSGMKQRLKLAQAIFSDVPVLLLDEPCTNLDTSGYQLYDELISNYCRHKLVIVSSNEEQEISFCKERISITDYKK